MMMRCSALALLVVAACTDAPTPAPPGTRTIAAANFDAEFDATLCALYVRCGVFEAEDTCVAFAHANRYEFLAGSSYLTDDLAHGMATYDGAAAGTCLDTIAADSCAALPGFVFDQIPAAVSGLRNQLASSWVLQFCAPDKIGDIAVDDTLFVHGVLADGERCSDSAQCASGPCLPDIAGGPQMCTEVVPVPILPAMKTGAICALGVSTCGAGDECMPQDPSSPSDTWICKPLAHAGEPCDIVGCASMDLQCGAYGLCVPYINQGQSCDDGSCKADSICDLWSNTCQPMPTLGQACNDVINGGFDAEFACAPGLQCVGNAEGTGNVCVQ